MFSGLLPSFTSLWGTAALFVLALLLGWPVVGTKRLERYLIWLLLLFVPSCCMIDAVVSQQKRGRKEYASAADLFAQMQVLLPGNAKQIVAYDYGSVGYVQFVATSDELRVWLRETFDEHIDPESEIPAPAELADARESEFRYKFKRTDFRYRPGMVRYLFSRGGGVISIWHLPSTGETCMSSSSF